MHLWWSCRANSFERLMSSSQCRPRLLYCLFDPAESLPIDVPGKPGTDLQVHIVVLLAVWNLVLVNRSHVVGIRSDCRKPQLHMVCNYSVCSRQQSGKLWPFLLSYLEPVIEKLRSRNVWTS